MKKPHGVIGLAGREFKRRLARPLSHRRHARNRRVNHLADDFDEARGRHGIPQPPAAHAVRFAKSVDGDHLIQHFPFRQERPVFAFPDHVAIRLIAKDGNISAANQIR